VSIEVPISGEGGSPDLTATQLGMIVGSYEGA